MLPRIKKALRKNREPYDKLSHVWQWALKEIDDVKIREDYFEQMAYNNLVKGFTFNLSENAIKNLGRAVGAVQVVNPEHGFLHITLEYYISDDEILDMIQEKLGFKIQLPLFNGGYNGAPTKYGMISDRHIHYLLIMKRIIDMFPDRNTRIIEIGAGAGILGYYLNNEGYKDYTTIDLAYANAVQAYYLYRNLPNRNLILSGEVENPFDESHKDSIKLLHASDFKNAPPYRFDLMINTDGFVEMHKEDAARYIKSDCAANLLSINHEMYSFKVNDLYQPEKILKYRFPFWLREGYVEEFFEDNA